jgi:hypothetical protein
VIPRTGLIWFRTATSGGILGTQQHNFGLQKCREFLEYLRNYMLLTKEFSPGR